MAAFPLLNLPPNLQQAIVSKLELPDKFLFSQCSKKTFDIVRTAHLKSWTPLLLYITTTDSIDITLRYFLDEDESFELQWCFYNKRDPEILDLENPKPYKVNGLAQTILLCQDSEEFREFRCASYLSPNELLLFIAQIFKLFSPQMEYLSFDSETIDYLTVLISRWRLTSCRSIYLDDIRLTHEEMTVILGIRAQELMILCRTDKGFRYDKEISADLIFLYSVPWINLRKIDCKYFCLNDCDLKNQDFNSFIHHWLNGTDKKLEYIVCWTQEDDDMDLSEIAKGLPKIPGSLKRPEATRFSRESGLGQIAYEKGFDFKRESDGMLATAMVSVDKGIKVFAFVVWYDPNPYLIQL